MGRTRAALGSAAFFLAAPAVVAGLIPWWLTSWHVREPFTHWAAARLIGIGLTFAGTAALVHAFARFVIEGRGTPAPVAPTERLVVGGLYRHVRNPMYVAILVTVVGEALALGQLVLLAYAAVLFGAFAAFVCWYEEPTLHRRFGSQYERYRQAVPGWLPRVRPWRGVP